MHTFFRWARRIVRQLQLNRPILCGQYKKEACKG